MIRQSELFFIDYRTHELTNIDFLIIARFLPINAIIKHARLFNMAPQIKMTDIIIKRRIKKALNVNKPIKDINLAYTITDLPNLYKEIKIRKPELITVNKSKPAITEFKPLKTLTVESEKLKILLNIKRKAKPDDIILKKKAKLMILSTVSKILVSRFSFIDDGSDNNKKENDVNKAIKNYLIFIGVIISDLNLKRLIFVTINKDGDFKSTIFVIDKHLRLFVLTSSHE
jgi:hypothetical protein